MQEVGGIFLETSSSSSCPHHQPRLFRQASNSAHTIDIRQNSLDTVLSALNAKFLQTHHHLVQGVDKDIGWVIIYKGDKLSLWKKHHADWQQVEEVIPTILIRYQRLKQFAHIHVSAMMKLEECRESEEAHLRIVQEIQIVWIPMLRLLVQKNNLDLLNAEDMEMHLTIIKETIVCMQQLCAIAWKPASILQLQAQYTSRLKPAIDYHNFKATDIQLNALHDVVMKWQLVHGLEAARSRTIVASLHGPRIGRIEAQYFEHWYKKALDIAEVEDNMLYSIETLPCEIKDLDVKKELILGFLMSAEVNKTIGEKILGNRRKMFSDILESYAAPVLERLFSESRLERNKYK